MNATSAEVIEVVSDFPDMQELCGIERKPRHSQCNMLS